MKQIDFDVRVWNLTPSGVEDNTQTRQQMLDYLHANYPVSDGWKVESVNPAGIHGGAISIVTFMTKWADETAPVSKSK